MSLTDAKKIVRFGAPVALVSLSAYASQIVDLAVVGHVLGADALAGVCLCHVIINLTQEPAAFITANAITTLCADVFFVKNYGQVFIYLRAAAVFSLLLTLPFGALMLATPTLFSYFATHTLPASVLGAIATYAPWYIFAITPALLLSALLGFLRAQGRLRTTALCCAVSVGLNAGLALLVVPRAGLVGSALASAATRYATIVILALVHRRYLDPNSGGGGASPASAAAAAAAASSLGSPLAALGRHYAYSLLPATLRIGVAQLLSLFALVLPSGGCMAAACVSLVTLLLQTSLALCMGVQQATLMLTSRYLSSGREEAARQVMRIAGLLLAALSLLVALLDAFPLKTSLGYLFTADPRIASTLDTLCFYIAPCLLLKSLSGLYGQFFALTQRGVLGTWILFVVHWCFGLPAAYEYAFLTRGGALALVQAHTATWLLATLGFVACYACQPTAVARVATVSPVPAAPATVPGGPPLARPLLQPDGRPAHDEL